MIAWTPVEELNHGRSQRRQRQLVQACRFNAACLCGNVQRVCRRQANGWSDAFATRRGSSFPGTQRWRYCPTKVTVRFGLREMGVAPAGLDRPNSGHHHLLIDTDLPPLNEPIPNDFNHLHFGAGQTEAQVTLKPGPHTLQLLLGDKDHIPHSPPVMSPRIRVIASDATTSPQVAAASVKKRRHAQARSRNYHSSAAYRKY